MKYQPVGFKIDQLEQEIASAKGEVKDKNREIVMEVVNEIASFKNVSGQKEIKKTVLDTDHIVYWYSEKMPTLDGKSRKIMLEVHVNPETDYSEMFIIVEFYDGDQITANVVVEDIEDYAPGEIDQLEAGIVAATEKEDDTLDDKVVDDHERQMTASSSRLTSSEDVDKDAFYEKKQDGDVVEAVPMQPAMSSTDTTSTEQLDLDVSAIEPTQKDFDRVDNFGYDLSFGKCHFYGSGAPFSFNAVKMAKSIKDKKKLIQRSKAVIARWGTRDYNGGYRDKNGEQQWKAENVWKPFEEALKNAGFSSEDISTVEDYDGPVMSSAINSSASLNADNSMELYRALETVSDILGEEVGDLIQALSKTSVIKGDIIQDLYKISTSGSIDQGKVNE